MAFTVSVTDCIDGFLLIIGGDRIILLCRARNEMQCTDSLHQSYRAGLCVGINWNWNIAKLICECCVGWNDAFSQNEPFCFPFDLLFVDWLWSLSLCGWCAEYLHSSRPWSFILKSLFNLLCAQNLDLSTICTFWTCRSCACIRRGTDGRNVSLQRHPLPIFLILPKCTTMRYCKFIALQYFPFYFYWVLSAFADPIFQVWACCIFSSSYAGLCCA